MVRQSAFKLTETRTHEFPDEYPDREPPETPAPIFAARALKSAIFGIRGLILAFLTRLLSIKIKNKVFKGGEPFL